MRHFPLPSFRHLSRIALLALAGAGLAGCQAQQDLLHYGSNWRPTGVVQADIDAQLADPHDAIRGRGTNTIPASIVVPAVEKWESGAASGGSTQQGAAGSASAGTASAGGGATGGGTAGSSSGMP